MKLSAILVSVNIVAAMPVAARAADEAVSDKASWLKQNLASLEKTKKPVPRQVSLSDCSVARTAATVRLRPFVANRRLPSRHELEMQLVSQQAKLDDSRLAADTRATDAGRSLTGQVSTCSMQLDPSPYSQIPASLSADTERGRRKARRPAPRAIPGQEPSLPGQVNYLQARAAAIPRIPDPPSAASCAPLRIPEPARAFNQQLTAGEHIVRQSGALLVQAPVLSPDEKEMFGELMRLNQPGQSAEFVDLPGCGAARAAVPLRPDPGPPPFPLNMLPESALKDLIGRGRNKIDAPPCYFGSWHRPVADRNLPEAGFHSHITRKVTGRSFQGYAPIVARYSAACPAVRRPRGETPASLSGHGVFTYTAAAQPGVAMYPPYGY